MRKDRVRVCWLSMVAALVVWSSTESKAAQTESGAAQDEAAREVVEIVAERFSFFPSEVRVPVGTTIEIRVRSEDTTHGFRLVDDDQVVADLSVPKRRMGEAVLVFEATEVGRYRFECSRLCGAGHNFMRGEIIVTPRETATTADEEAR